MGDIVFLIPLAGIAAGVVLALPVIRLIVRVVERKFLTEPAAPSLDADRVHTELEEVKRRIEELEERQDFAERMLTRGRAGERVEERT